MRLLRSVTVAALMLGSAACSSTSSSQSRAVPGNSCSARPGSGTVCIDVIAKNGTIGDVIGYLSSSDSPLAHTHWRLVLTQYNCDPGSAAAPECAPVRTYPGTTRSGVPPIETDCRLSNGTFDTTSPGCHGTLAAEYATHGDWSGFPLTDKPFTVQRKTWLCVSEQVRVGSTWAAPAVATDPVRACSSVSRA